MRTESATYYDNAPSTNRPRMANRIPMLSDSKAGGMTPKELIDRQRIETEHRPVDAKDPPARTQ